MDSLFRSAGLLLSTFILAVGSAACSGGSAASPRLLKPDELRRLTITGAVSPHLPIRFSAQIHNGNPDITITAIRLRVHGREIDRLKRIAAGETARVSVQFIYPEDADWGRIDPDAVQWSLVQASGIEGPP